MKPFAAIAIREVVAGIEVDPARMWSNLDATGGVLMTERLEVFVDRALDAHRQAVGAAA